jgi:hypothetical protein
VNSRESGRYSFGRGNVSANIESAVYSVNEGYVTVSLGLKLNVGASTRASRLCWVSPNSVNKLSEPGSRVVGVEFRMLDESQCDDCDEGKADEDRNWAWRARPDSCGEEA